MIDHPRLDGTEAGRAGGAPPLSPMAMCPMGAMCERMLNKPHSGFAPLIAGVALIVVGALIFVEPRILVWLAGAALVLFGFMMLMLSRFIRKLGVERRSR